jgi:hypothetical protein
VEIKLIDLGRRKSSATAENLEVCHQAVHATRTRLEGHLETMNEKLELILQGNIAEPELNAGEVAMIKEERLSAEKGLQICAQLTDYITQIQLATKESYGRTKSADSITMPQKITNEGLEDCKTNLARTAQRLEGYEKQLFARLMDKVQNSSASQEDRIDLIRLRDEWEATRKGMDICLKASDLLKDSVSTIENHAEGDAIQIMVSTEGIPLRGINRGLGSKTGQVGGYMGEESLQQIVRSLPNITISTREHIESLSPTNPRSISEDRVRTNSDSKFNEHYGRGFKLQSEGSSSEGTSSTVLVESIPSTLS